MRYEVRPIDNENCDSVTDTVILATDSLDEAKAAAGSAAYDFGAGITDTQDGSLDVGFGFGVPCPEKFDDILDAE